MISTATASSRKRPPKELGMSPAAHSVANSSISTAATSGIATLFSSGNNVNMNSSFRGRESKQMRLTSVKVDPDAPKKLDIALSMLSHCLGHEFKLAKDPLMCRVIEVARTLPPGRYTPPDKNRVAGELLDAVYDASMDENLDRLVDEADTFGLTAYGDLATIRKYACANFLAAGVNNPFSIQDFFDCSEQCKQGEAKDAKYLAKKFVPHIRALEQRPKKSNGRGTPGIVDLIIFDGASNVQKAARIMRARFGKRLYCIHGAEHVMGLVFKDIFTLCNKYVQLASFAKKCRNVFGSTRHAPTAMFRKRAKEHNGGRRIGFIKVSECR